MRKIRISIFIMLLLSTVMIALPPHLSQSQSKVKVDDEVVTESVSNIKGVIDTVSEQRDAEVEKARLAAEATTRLEQQKQQQKKLLKLKRQLYQQKTAEDKPIADSDTVIIVVSDTVRKKNLFQRIFHKKNKR